MGLLRKTSAWGRKLRKLWHGGERRELETPLRICRFEQMEPRRMLAADIHVGAVYFEPAAGQDQTPNTFQISFNGGAAGTQLTQVVIEQDKAGDGLTIGDTFFDTASGGQGSFASHPFQLVDQGGIGSFAVTVADGGTKMILDFTGFEAGDKFTFAIDVDEKGFNGSNAVAEGNEFEGSTITASFIAPHYQNDQVTATFYDFFDQSFVGSGLANLPNDNYQLPGDPPGAAKDPVFTAGAAGELTQTALPSDIAGTVYEDVNLNNGLDGSDHGIGNVSLTLLEWQNGAYVSTGLTTTTDAQGHYQFLNLQPGSYRVVETQPSGYLSVGAQAGNINGVPDGSVLNVNAITDIVLLGGEQSVQNNFGEFRPVEIAGVVHVDYDGVCDDMGPPGDPLPGVTINLYDAGHNLVATTVTDDNGQFSFTELRPGEYAIEEVQPDGYLTIGAEAGTAGGNVDSSGNKITQIVLAGGQQSVDNEFCETPPASISGIVDSDPSGVCSDEMPGAPIAGVTINLFDSNHNLVASTLTDEHGEFRFDNLMPGVYSLEEVQPDGYLSIGAEAGTAGGVADSSGNAITFIDLIGGQASLDNMFCETPPACLEGYVYVDVNNDGAFGAGDQPLAGVTMQLLDADGNPTGVTTVTDATGAYGFCDLFPGTYGVAEAHPHGYLQGTNTPGDAGGVVQGDTITGAVLTGGMDAMHYDFGELIPARISGYVFQDGGAIETPAGQTLSAQTILAQKSGQLDPTDKRLAGVVLQLGDAGGNLLLDANGHVIQTTTDANGYYEFNGLMPGTYSVFEIQPDGYVSGINTIGTTGGVAPKPGQSLSPQMLDVLGDRPYDAIVFVPLPAGAHSTLNNFSEVLITNPPPTPPNPPLTPPLNPPPPGTIPFTPFNPPGMPSTIPGGPGSVSMSPPPAMYYGDLGYSGSLPQGYSWHLSVIDGGRPRGDNSQNGSPFSVVDARSSVFVEASATLNQGRWMLPGSENGEPRIIPFGRPGSIPVTGDFNGDGSAEVGVFYEGQWFIDLNGNGRWDNDDLWASLGKAGDRPVTGDWDGDGKTDIGIFGRSWEGDPRAAAAEPGLPDPHNAPNGARKNMPPAPHQATNGWRSLRRTDKSQTRSDLIDHVFYFGAPSDIPVSGDWNGDGVDTVGVFNAGVWILDVNGDGHWSPGEPMIELGQAGDQPVVGDWDGDGVDDLGVFRDGTFLLDTNHDRLLDAQDKVFELGGAGDKPVVGDWDGDGRDDVGVYRDNGTTTWNSL